MPKSDKEAAAAAETVDHTPAPKVAPVARNAKAPTLDEAFDTLAQALLPYCEENVPDHQHIQEVRGWYANGNIHVAWQHLAQALEGALGVKLFPH